MRHKPHPGKVTAAEGPGVSRVIQLLSNTTVVHLGLGCSVLLPSGLLLAKPNPVSEEVLLMQSVDARLWGTEQTEGVESAPAKKSSQLSRASSRFTQGSLDARTRTAHGQPGGGVHDGMESPRQECRGLWSS